MAAILNFSKILKISPAHHHIVGIIFYCKFLSFCKKNYEVDPWWPF